MSPNVPEGASLPSPSNSTLNCLRQTQLSTMFHRLPRLRRPNDFEWPYSVRSHPTAQLHPSSVPQQFYCSACATRGSRILPHRSGSLAGSISSRSGLHRHPKFCPSFSCEGKVRDPSNAVGVLSAPTRRINWDSILDSYLDRKSLSAAIAPTFSMGGAMGRSW